eukprot:9494138-Pyramimonas_sp.AAC.1
MLQQLRMTSQTSSSCPLDLEGILTTLNKGFSPTPLFFRDGGRDILVRQICRQVDGTWAQGDKSVVKYDPTTSNCRQVRRAIWQQLPHLLAWGVARLRSAFLRSPRAPTMRITQLNKNIISPSAMSSDYSRGILAKLQKIAEPTSRCGQPTAQ